MMAICEKSFEKTFGMTNSYKIFSHFSYVANIVHKYLYA